MQLDVPENLNHDNILEFLRQVFEVSGGENYLGEPVTMQQHMLQAGILGEKGGKKDEVVVAALLHDIGHVISKYGTFSMSDTADRYHEEAGAELLEGLFPETVVNGVRYHVEAKRYLCAVKPSYYNRLSDASKHSLSLQGGPMDEEEVTQFESIPSYMDCVQVRYLDDAAKISDLQTPEFSHFEPLINRMLIGM